MELRTFRRVAGSVSVYAAEAALQVTPVLQTGAGIGVVVGLFFAESGPSAVSTAVRPRLPFGPLMVVTCLAGIGSISTSALLYGFIADCFLTAAGGSAIGLGRFGETPCNIT